MATNKLVPMEVTVAEIAPATPEAGEDPAAVDEAAEKASGSCPTRILRVGHFLFLWHNKPMHSNYTKHQNNNLSFYELSSPIVFSNVVAIQFQAGAITDTENNRGLAHLVEHLLTHDNKNTNSYLNNELTGVYQFAYTNKETTTYVFTSNSVSITDLTLRAILQVKQTISSMAIKEEKSVIRAEIQESKKQNSDKIYTKAINIHVNSIGNKYKNYCNDVRGTVKTLNNISEKDIHLFLKKYYINPKIVVTTSKPLSAEERKSIFGVIQKLNWRDKIQKQKNIKGVKSILKKSSIGNTTVMCLSVIRPRTSHYDVYLGLLLDYLAGNWSSVLNQSLRINKPLIYFAYGSYHSFKEHALIYVHFDFEKKNAPAIHKTVSEEMYRLFNDKDINSDILTAVKNIRVTKLRNLFRNEQDWALDYFDMTKLVNDSNQEDDYTLESYITDTLNISLQDFKKFLSELRVQIDF